MPIITINGKKFEVAKDKTILDLASDQEIAVRMNGVLVDLKTPIKDDCEIEFIKFDSEDGKQVYWHTTSHLMAHAVKELYPDVKLAIGPTISDGFYYDFDHATPFTEEDLKKIQDKMHEIKNRNLPIERIEMKRLVAIEFFRKLGEQYKVELLEAIDDGEVSLYKQGDFVDLCRGPHLPSTGHIGSFRLLAVAGAYWRGDEHRPMLSRIYGISFPTSEELDRYLVMREEAKSRDHRVIGKQLDLFSIVEDAGAGLVFWHPAGATILDVISRFWTDEHIKHGYEIVQTPHILRDALFRTSGHYDFYRDNLYTLDVEGQEFVLKPMNCPGHFVIFMSQTRSYRDLPIRYAELGTVYRRERSGTLHGLMRVRGFTIDDAHIFCTPEQITDEITECLKFSLFFLKAFNFKDYHLELSVRDPYNRVKYAGSDEEWDRAEVSLLDAAKNVGFEPKRMEGEAVFYGPKLDIKLHDALGRSRQGTTIQFDFNLPKRFGAGYITKSGEKKEVVAVHRALLGSLERFVGILIEHYGGDFPVWLAPVQIVVMPVSEKQSDYVKKVINRFQRAKLRVETDLRNERLNYRIREAEMKKVPYMVIVGNKEVKKKRISVRKRKEGDLGDMAITDFLKRVKDEIKKRT